MDLTKVDNIIDHYDGEKAWLVMILQDVQEAYNYLPARALTRVTERLGVPASLVYRVATFYASFSLKERGKHLVRVCDGTACHLRGAVNIREEITRQLNILPEETTSDKMFTLVSVACLGACALAPAMMIDREYYGNLTPETVKQVLAACRDKACADDQTAGAAKGAAT